MRYRLVVLTIIADLVVLSQGARGQNVNVKAGNDGRQSTIATSSTPSVRKMKSLKKTKSEPAGFQLKNRSQEEVADEKITNSICVGCDR